MHAFRLGRILGIEVRVDWSWVFIFVLMTWNLFAVFTRWHPAWSPVEAGAVGLAATLIFFGCILLHELAHSVVAMRFGLRVRSITLFLFGGVSSIEHEPPSATAEFFTAIVGPLASIALGVVFFLLASLQMTVPMTGAESAWSAMAQFGPLETLLAWLGPINIVIGLFNLVPGFPLDGGRVLRAALWGITGDLRKSTRWAAATGQSIGWLFVAAGVAMTFGAHVPFFGTGLAGGLWLAFIGWFLHGAAARAATRLALDDTLAGLTVEHLMQHTVPSVPADRSVAALVHEHLVPGEDRAIAVVREGALLGLVSISDVRALPPDRWAATSVGSIMRPVEALTLAKPEESLTEAFGQLSQRDIGQLPVVVGGKLVGMLRRRDVTRWLELAWRPGSAAARKTATLGGAAMPNAPRRAGSDRPMPGGGAHPVV